MQSMNICLLMPTVNLQLNLVANLFTNILQQGNPEKYPLYYGAKPASKLGNVCILYEMALLRLLHYKWGEGGGIPRELQIINNYSCCYIIVE